MKTLITTLATILISLAAFGQGNVSKSFQILGHSEGLKDSVSIHKNIKSHLTDQIRVEKSDVTKESLKIQRKLERKKLREIKYEPRNVSFYGGGNIFGSVTGNSDSTRTIAPTGQLGLNIYSPKNTWDLSYTISKLEDTEINSFEQFGAFLLNPKLANQTFSLDIKSKFKDRIGYIGLLNIGNTRWKFENQETINATLLLFKPSLFWTPFAVNKENSSPEQPIENSFSITLTGGLSYRTILGDFERKAHTINGVSVVK